MSIMKSGPDDSKMVGGGREEHDIHSQKLVETREVGCNTAPLQRSPPPQSIETKHHGGDQTK